MWPDMRSILVCAKSCAHFHTELGVKWSLLGIAEMNIKCNNTEKSQAAKNPSLWTTIKFLIPYFSQKCTKSNKTKGDTRFLNTYYLSVSRLNLRVSLTFSRRKRRKRETIHAFLWDSSIVISIMTAEIFSNLIIGRCSNYLRIDYIERCASNDPGPHPFRLSLVFLHSSLSLSAGFPTLLTFDSPLPGIKYSWALCTAPPRGTLHRSRNPQEISKVLLPWPGPRNTSEHCAFERNPEANAAKSNSYFAAFVGELSFYYVFGGALVPTHRLDCVIVSKLLHFSLEPVSILLYKSLDTSCG